MTKKNDEYIQRARSYLWWLGAVDRYAFQIFAPWQSGWSEKRREDLSWLLSAPCYKVARNLPISPKESKRFKKIFDIVDPVAGIIRDSQAIDAVEHVRKEIEEFYEESSPVLASKLLWFKFQSPIIICDRFTAIALELPSDWKKTSYEVFYKKWREEFQKEEDKILIACDAFRKNHPERKRTVSQRWFKERVFDFYLLNKGGMYFNLQ